jgi:hypothetical protein
MEVSTEEQADEKRRSDALEIHMHGYYRAGLTVPGHLLTVFVHGWLSMESCNIDTSHERA